MRGSSGGYTTVYSTTTSITLRGLDPGAEYDVEVAAVDLCGRMNGYSEVAGLNLEGKFACVHTYVHSSFSYDKHANYKHLRSTYSI